MKINFDPSEQEEFRWKNRVSEDGRGALLEQFDETATITFEPTRRNTHTFLIGFMSWQPGFI